MNASSIVDPIPLDSPLVDSIVRDEIISLGRYRGLPEPTSAQRLQSNRLQVARILNCCFWAGLAQEEGRPVSSGITFASPDDASNQLQLATPSPVTVEALVKLGTVAGTSQSLAVHEANGEAQIWGFVRGQMPYWVTIWFDRPASLRVTVARAGVISLLDRGRVFVPQGQLLANPGNLNVQLQRLLGPALSQYSLEGLTFIAREMGRHGHGGTLLIVDPESESWRSHLQITDKLADESYALLRDMDRRLRRPDDSESLPREFLQDEVIRIASQIAGLTRIDGATVISRDLGVFGFGAHVTTPDNGFQRPSLETRTIYDTDFVPAAWIELGGTRHQSAARFVAATRDNVAFVSSHDGGLSVLAWSADDGRERLRWLRGLEGLIGPI